MRTSGQDTLKAAMLIAQGYFQVVDGLTMALETEVPRFYDTGMHRSDRYFVYF
jgi:hypothetical protein